MKKIDIEIKRMAAEIKMLKFAIKDAGMRFAAMGVNGCANDGVAKNELLRLAARCCEIADAKTLEDMQ